MPQERERAVDGPCCQRALGGGPALTGLSHRTESLPFVLGDPTGGDLRQWCVRPEELLEVPQDANVVAKRALSRLGQNVALRGPGQRKVRRHRLGLVLDLQQHGSKGLLGVVLRPFRFVDTLLLTVHLDGEAPRLAPRALAWSSPEPLTHSRHVVSSLRNTSSPHSICRSRPASRGGSDRLAAR